MYPFFLFALQPFLRKKIQKNIIYPKISLVVSCYNEEKVIEEKIKNILLLDYPKEKLEVVFASESNDKTNFIIKKYNEENFKLFAYEGRRGKQSTLWRTIPHCSGEIIVFSDANAFYKGDALKNIVKNFFDERVGAVSGLLQYKKISTSSSVNEGIYWKYEFFLKNLESKIGSLLGANGSIFAIRKSLYRPLSEWRGDDYELPVIVAEDGFLSILEKDAVSFEAPYETQKEINKRKLVIVSWHFKSSLLLLKRALLKRAFLQFFQIISHKVLRWLVGIFLIILFLSNLFLLSHTFFQVFLFAQVLFYFFAVLGIIFEKKQKNIRIFSIPYYFCSINYIGLLGSFRGLFSKTSPTWEIVRHV